MSLLVVEKILKWENVEENNHPLGWFLFGKYFYKIIRKNTCHAMSKML